MDDLKNRMYNYEATPPAGVWNAIVTELDGNEAKVIPLKKKKNNTFYYVAAASVVLILFSVIYFANRSSKSNEQFVSSTDKANDTSVSNNLIMTVPAEDKSIAKNSDNANLPKQNKSQKGVPNQDQPKDRVNNNDSNLLANNTATRYITIEGPQGQPVKISSKMASLIDSSETKVLTKPVWHKKIDEWKEIMKTNTLAPTPGNFLDIVELTKSLRDNKK